MVFHSKTVTKLKFKVGITKGKKNKVILVAWKERVQNKGHDLQSYLNLS